MHQKTGDGHVIKDWSSRHVNMMYERIFWQLISGQYPIWWPESTWQRKQARSPLVVLTSPVDCQDVPDMKVELSKIVAGQPWPTDRKNCSYLVSIPV